MEPELGYQFDSDIKPVDVNVSRRERQLERSKRDDGGEEESSTHVGGDRRTR